MHDGNDLYAILSSAIDDAIRKTHDPTLSYIAFNATIKKRISSDSRDGVVKCFEKSHFETRLLRSIKCGRLVGFLKRLRMKPTRLHEYFF